VSDYIYQILSRVLVVLLLLPVHEFAHAYVAYKFGDNTANYSGRLTLNPLSHLDPVGTPLLVLTGYGWAKAVPINPRNFKDRKLGTGLTALAGPVSNILMSYILLLILRLFYLIIPHINLNEQAIGVVISIITQMAWISVVLAVFNMIPLPPLDGSKVAFMLLPYKWYFKVLQYERYVYIALAVVMFSGILSTPISYVSNFIFDGLCFLAGF
jgi:Zn-dependent protease